MDYRTCEGIDKAKKKTDPPKNTKLFLVWVGDHLHGVYDNKEQASDLESKLESRYWIIDTAFITTTRLNDRY